MTPASEVLDERASLPRCGIGRDTSPHLGYLSRLYSFLSSEVLHKKILHSHEELSKKDTDQAQTLSSSNG